MDEEEPKPGRCCQDNCLNPQAPEYKKCHKAINNCGCCGVVGNHEEEEEEEIRVVRSSRHR